MNESSVSRRAGIDPEALGDWLGVLGHPVGSPLRIAPIGLGKSNITLLVSDARGRRVIVRRPPVGPLLPSAHDIRREARILAALGDTAVPAPRLLGVGGEDAVCAAPMLAMEHVDGVVLDRPDPATAMAVAARRRVGPALLDVLAALHDVDVEAAGLAALTGRRPYAERQLRTWRRQSRGRNRDPVPAVEAIADRLEATIPPQSETTLVHGDCHVLNAILDPTAGSVRALLDWELATLGDPVADLGTFLAYWSSPLGPPYDVTGLDGFSLCDELASHYESTTGRDLASLAFWWALAYWKIAVIGLGVMERGASDSFDESVICSLLERAVATADQGGL